MKMAKKNFNVRNYTNNSDVNELSYSISVIKNYHKSL